MFWRSQATSDSALMHNEYRIRIPFKCDVTGADQVMAISVWLKCTNEIPVGGLDGSAIEKQQGISFCFLGKFFCW